MLPNAYIKQWICYLKWTGERTSASGDFIQNSGFSQSFNILIILKTQRKQSQPQFKVQVIEFCFIYCRNSNQTPLGIRLCDVSSICIRMHTKHIHVNITKWTDKVLSIIYLCICHHKYIYAHVHIYVCTHISIKNFNYLRGTMETWGIGRREGRLEMIWIQYS